MDILEKHEIFPKIVWTEAPSREKILVRQLQMIQRHVRLNDWVLLAAPDEFHDYGRDSRGRLMTIPTMIRRMEAWNASLAYGVVRDRHAPKCELVDVQPPVVEAIEATFPCHSNLTTEVLFGTEYRVVMHKVGAL